MHAYKSGDEVKSILLKKAWSCRIVITTTELWVWRKEWFELKSCFAESHSAEEDWWENFSISVLVKQPWEFSVPFHSAVIVSNVADSWAAAIDLMGIYIVLTRLEHGQAVTLMAVLGTD